MLLGSDQLTQVGEILCDVTNLCAKGKIWVDAFQTNGVALILGHQIGRIALQLLWWFGRMSCVNFWDTQISFWMLLFPPLRRMDWRDTKIERRHLARSRETVTWKKRDGYGSWKAEGKFAGNASFGRPTEEGHDGRVPPVWQQSDGVFPLHKLASKKRSRRIEKGETGLQKEGKKQRHRKTQRGRCTERQIDRRI